MTPVYRFEVKNNANSKEQNLTMCLTCETEYCTFANMNAKDIIFLMEVFDSTPNSGYSLYKD